MKKLIALLLSFILVFACCTIASATGSESASCSGESTVTEGEEIKVTFSLAGYGNVTSGGVTVYHGDEFEIVSGTWLRDDAKMDDFNKANQQGVLLFEEPTDVNGEIFELVLKGKTMSASAKNVSATFTMKNGATSLPETTATKSIKITCVTHEHSEWKKVDETNHSRICFACEETESKKHKWDSGEVIKKASCKAEGSTKYTCTDCGATKTETIKITHKYKVTKTVDATTSKSGKIYKKCSSCSKTTTETIYYPKTISLSKTKYTYDGKTHKPTVTVKDSKGNTVSSSNYTVSYSSGCKSVGSYKVTVKFKGNYSGTVTKSFKIEQASQTISAKDFAKKMGDSSFYLKATVTKGDGKLSYKSSDTKIAKVSSSGKITLTGVGKATITITAAETKNYDKETEKITITVKPKTTSIKSLTSSDDGEFTVKWSKDSAVTYYQVQYSTSSDFDKAVTITASSISSLTVEGLEENTTYYVRIRTYKKVDGTKYYSSWSSVKSVQ